MADDYAASTSTTGFIPIGGSITGNIETTGDADWFKVTLVAGKTYQFDLEGVATGQGTLTNAFLELRDSSGASLVYDFGGGVGANGGNNSRLTFTAVTGGTYYLSSDPALNNTGTYNITATQIATLADDYAASTSTTGFLAVGGSIVGNIETATDADWFKMTLVAGQTYQFDLKGNPTGDGTLQYTYLHLRDNKGAVLLTDNHSGDAGPGTGANSRITYTATRSGTYYLSSDPSGLTGTYKISAIQLPSVIDDYAASTATTGLISLDGSVTGKIETTGDADWFKVTLSEGVLYQFDFEGAHTSKGTLVDAVTVEIRNPTGALISSDDGAFGGDGTGPGTNSRLFFVAPETGTYFLAAHATESGIGTYILTVSSPSAPPPEITSDLLFRQQAILRFEVPQEAADVGQQIIHGQATIDDYTNILIERAETSTQPSLLISDLVMGRIPTAIHLGELSVFAQTQYEYYAHVLKVATPELGPYEALGRGFSHTTEFSIMSIGRTDTQFIAEVYAKASVSNQQPTQAILDHYQKQIDYFVSIYTSAGLTPLNANIEARGAVLGQIVGANAIVEDSPVDLLAEQFFHFAAVDAVQYNVPLLVSMPIVDPVPLAGDLFL